MASFEKMAKLLLEETTKTSAAAAQIARDTALLRAIAQNQEIIIVQNKKLIELLAQCLAAKTAE